MGLREFLGDALAEEACEHLGGREEAVASGVPLSAGCIETAVGYQAFLDGRIDLYVNCCIDPCGQFIQFIETEELRFIGPEDDSGNVVD